MKLTIVDLAATEIIKLINMDELPASAGLQVGINGGGCSGFEYTCKIAFGPGKDDHVFTHNGANVFVDRKSAVFLDGTIVDYKSGLMDAGFKFYNPNSTGDCGCGKSFAV